MSDLKKVFFYNNHELDHSNFIETRKYGYRFQNFENEKLTKELHYEVEINCKNHETRTGFVYEISKKQIYINQKEPELLIEQLLDKCSTIIYPLKISTTKQGTLYEICNHDEIMTRWRSVRDELSTYYYSEIAYKILNKIQKILFDKEELQKALKKDWLFHLYFPPLYIDYTADMVQNYDWKSPVFGNQSIDYNVSQKIEEYYTATNKIIINTKGKSIDQRSLEEVLKGINYPQAKLQGKQYKTLESEMEVQYKLYGEDKSIFSIISTFNTKISETKNKIQKIALYHLVVDENYRPESDEIERTAKAQFEGFQTMGDEDIIDLSKIIFKETESIPAPLYQKQQKAISFFVEEISITKRKNLTERFITLFRKNKK